MENSKFYKGELYGYCEVERLRDEKLLTACEKAVEVILSHDWHDMNNEKGKRGLYARFNVEGTEFVDCKVIIRNLDGTISSKFVGKLHEGTPYNDFKIDLYSHPKIGELDQYLPH